MTRCPHALYVGWVRHRRRDVVNHGFRYRVAWAWLDLDHLHTAFRVHPLWRRERAAPVSFHRQDYLAGHADLRTAVRDRVQHETGRRPDGPIALLTVLRCWGMAFNPVSFYYCFDATGRHVEHVLAEITNTPWRERHVYVSSAGSGSTSVHARHRKRFHVSPFFSMDHDYRWLFAAPGERLGIHMRNLRDGQDVFDATLVLRRQPWDALRLSRTLVRFPHLVLLILIGIYSQALRLWWRGARFHPHPQRA